jgi:hypothetical protein
MYRFFITEIDMAEVVRQLQNKATAKSLQQQKLKPVKPLPTNFHYNASKVYIVFVFLSVARLVSHNNVLLVHYIH